jgi:hypothetical protein
MTQGFKYNSYEDADRIAILENRAAELERRLLAVMTPESAAGSRVPHGGAAGRRAIRWANLGPPDGVYQDGVYQDGSYLDDAAEPYLGDAYQEAPAAAAGPAGETGPERGGYQEQPLPGYPAGGGVPGPDGRTEALISHGRQRARRSRGGRVLGHWRLIAVGVVALLAGVIAAVVATGSSGGSWPQSVATVTAEIKRACANPDVAAEPTGLNFACGKDTQQVLWVFALLTSGDNPGFVDQATGRKGLEPIQPSQGGDIAWSLNLHHPYNAASPVDSLEVAARAINNIISGATLTSANGGALIEAGLESKAANCQRYTGSAKLVSRSGYPAQCAAPLTPGAGQAALVSDVFQQWMGGTPSRIATQAGVLFQNAGNPGNPQVQAILSSLPSGG